jgi:hypothetical protein
MTNVEKMEALVKELALVFPGLGLSFGYIGNCGRGYDDRGWKVFTKVRDKKYGLSVSYGLADTKGLERACGLYGRMAVVNFATKWDKEELA